MDGMALPSTTPAKIGRWWFQRRSLSPLPFLLLMLILPPDLHWSGAGYLLPLAGVGLAECLRLWAVGYAGSATRTRGDTVSDFVHAGPYRYVRNPLYVANILLYTSCCVAFGFLYLSLALFIYSCVQYTFIVAFEEEILSRTFGAPYENFRAKVPRWLVSPVPCIESTRHRFEASRAFRSERSTLFALAAMTAVLVVKSQFFG